VSKIESFCHLFNIGNEISKFHNFNSCKDRKKAAIKRQKYYVDSIMNDELFGVDSGFALPDETETMLLFRTATLPLPPSISGKLNIEN
jgi:hypothetical protein